MADLTLDPPRSDTGRRSLTLGALGHLVNDAYTAFLPAMLPMLHLQLGLDEVQFYVRALAPEEHRLGRQLGAVVTDRPLRRSTQSSGSTRRFERRSRRCHGHRLSVEIYLAGQRPP